MLLPVMAEVQPDELAVPVERDVLVDCGLAKNVPDILCNSTTDKRNQSKLLKLREQT